MPGDCSCDEDLQFETALWDQAQEFWGDISSKFRGKNNKNKCTEIVISSCKQDSCHIYDTTTNTECSLRDLETLFYSTILTCQNGRDILFQFVFVFVFVLNEKDILLWIYIKYYTVLLHVAWLTSIHGPLSHLKHFLWPFRFVFEYPCSIWCLFEHIKRDLIQESGLHFNFSFNN